MTAVDASGANDLQRANSQGLGGTAQSGDNWHMVWIREGSTPGRAKLWAHRLHDTGLDVDSSAPFQVDGASDFAHPDVSSLLDEPDAFTGQHGAIVVAEAFNFYNLRPGGYWTDIEVRLISNDASNGERARLSEMEDVTQGLLQVRTASQPTVSRST